MKSIFEIPLTNIRELAECVAQSESPKQTYEDGVYTRFKNECISFLSKWHDKKTWEEQKEITRAELDKIIHEKQKEFIEFIARFREALFQVNPKVANKVFPVYVDSSVFNPYSNKDYLRSEK